MCSFVLNSNIITTYGTTSLPLSSDTTITSSVSSVHEGYTKAMTLTCRVSLTSTSQLSMVSSLILGKTSTTDDNNFSEIATVSQLSPSTVDVKNTLGANVTGQLTSSRDAYITYTWRYPSRDVTGKYSCTAHGLDKLGHAINENPSTTSVESQELDLEMLLQKMKQLEVNQDALKTQLANQQAQEKHDWNDTKTLMTEDSVVYQGHQYMLSTPTNLNVPLAEIMCRHFGGYLLEVNDQAEFKVVQNMLKSYTDDTIDYVMIGATDAETEGQWKFLYSHANMTYFDWHSGFSGHGGFGKNCLFLSNYQKMYDYPCVQNRLGRFVCEIPM